MSVIWSLHFGRLGASVEDVSLANLRGLHADRRRRRSGKRRTPITLFRSQIGLVLLNLAQVILDWVLQSLEPVLDRPVSISLFRRSPQSLRRLHWGCAADFWPKGQTGCSTFTAGPVFDGGGAGNCRNGDRLDLGWSSTQSLTCCTCQRISGASALS